MDKKDVDIKKCSILLVLKQITKPDYGRLLPSQSVENELNCPPLLVWNFEDENNELNKKIIDEFRKFESKIEWHLGFQNNKWAFYPKRLDDICKEQKLIGITDAMSWIIKNDPEFGYLANAELARLARHLKEKFSK